MTSILDDSSIKGLTAIQRYRYLTIDQFAKITGNSYSQSGKILLRLEKTKFLDSFGNQPLSGRTRTKKAYYLKRKGYEFLLNDCGLTVESLGKYRQVKTDAVWRNRMEHRLALVDTFISIEIEFENQATIDLSNIFLEYFKSPSASGGVASETTDNFTATTGQDIKIIPDGCFIIQSKTTKEKYLYFVEIDMGTETVASNGQLYGNNIVGKYEKYIEYLKSGQFKSKYKEHGDFDFFTMIFITKSPKRTINIWNNLDWLRSEFGSYFYLTCFDYFETGCLSKIWLSAENDLVTSLLD